MSRFELYINLGNAEMQDARHIADALRDVADRIEQIDGSLGVVRIRDINGNTVGCCGIEEESA